MKGIDAAVATILLLMITISLVGFAFVWFNRLSRSAAKSIENKTLEQLKEQSMEAAIISASASGLIVSNTGTAAIPAGRMSVIVEGNLLGTNPSDIPPGQTVQLTTLSGGTFSCLPGDEVTIVVGRSRDTTFCE